MTTQKNLRFTVPRLAGETSSIHAHRERVLNNGGGNSIAPEKLFADLLKRQARRVMADITECPSDTLPAHLARLDGLREIINHALRHDLLPGCETRLSGNQLLYAATVADFLACLEITRQTHRAPAFVNGRDAELAEVNHKLDLLAGLFARSGAVDAVLSESIAADAAEDMGAAWKGGAL